MNIKLLFILLSFMLLVACQSATIPSKQNSQATPVASFTLTPETGTAPLDIAVDATGSSASDGSIIAYRWSFGDGTTKPGLKASHIFTEAGEFTVTLTVTDSQGLSASNSRSVTIQASATPTDPSPANPDPSTPEPIQPVPSNELQTIRAAWDSSQLMLASPADFTRSGVDAVLFASQQSNGGTQLVVTGTVRETSEGSFSYEASPNDKLVLISLNGAQLEFVFSQLQGNFSEDGANFINNDHASAFTLNGKTQASSVALAIQSARLPRAEGRARDTLETVKGSYVDANGVLWQADITTQGIYLFDVDSTQLETVAQTSGSLTASSLDFSMNLDSEETYKTINLVENFKYRLAHSWQLGASQYQFSDAGLFIALRENKPVDQDQWIISGVLTKDGTVFGQIAEDNSDSSHLQVSLFIGDEKLLLFSLSRF